jgi:hypothetical protein
MSDTLSLWFSLNTEDRVPLPRHKHENCVFYSQQTEIQNIPKWTIAISYESTLLCRLRVYVITAFSTLN